MIVTLATILTVLGTHKGVAAFILAYGGFFSIFALSSGLAISSGFPDDRDPARAGMVMCTVAALGSMVPAFLVYQDESTESSV